MSNQPSQSPTSSSALLLHFPLVIVSAVIAAEILPAFINHFMFSVNGFAVGHDSSQQLPPLISWLEQPSAVDPFITNYYLAWLPPLIKAPSWLFSKLGIDVVTTSIIIQYGSFALLALLGWFIGLRLGGIACAYGIVWLIVSTNVLYSSIGGIPRSFGFPLFIALFWLMVSQRFILMNMVTIIAAAIYPIASVVGGIALAIWLVGDTVKFGFRGNRKNRLRWAVICVAGIISVSLLLIKSEQIENQFGTAIQETEYAEFPEAGPEGRSWTRRVINTLPHINRIGDVIKNTLFAPERYFDLQISAKLLAVLLLAAFVFTIYDSRYRRPIIYFSAAVAVTYVLAEIAAPHLYFSHRYAYYSLPIIFIILVPYTLFRLSQIILSRTRKVSSVSWKQTGLFAVLSSVLIILIGGRFTETHGFYELAPDEIILLQHISTLPNDAKIATWPASSVANSIPLVSRRSVLLNDKFHQSFHREYILEMRCRAQAIFDAYFVPSIPNLTRLRDNFQVTHLIFDQRHLKDLYALSYFKPFNSQIKVLQQLAAQNPLHANYGNLGTHIGQFQIIPLERILQSRRSTKTPHSKCNESPKT